ncbi:hypothetical protein Dimus_025846 [Dionaea muscipula]
MAWRRGRRNPRPVAVSTPPPQRPSEIPNQRALRTRTVDFRGLRPPIQKPRRIMFPGNAHHRKRKPNNMSGDDDTRSTHAVIIDHNIHGAALQKNGGKAVVQVAQVKSKGIQIPRRIKFPGNAHHRERKPNNMSDGDDDTRSTHAVIVDHYNHGAALQKNGGKAVVQVAQVKSKGKEEVSGTNDTFTCELCAEGKPHHESFSVNGCHHTYCRDCIRNYVSSKLNDGVSQIVCPVLGCVGSLEPEFCRDVVSLTVFNRWGELLCESALTNNKFYCPFKDCSALLFDDGIEFVTRSECPHCWRLFCAQCRVVWHEGVSCDEVQRLNEDERASEDFMLRNLARNKNWKRCPMCKFYVEKIDGCLYMKCRCGGAFCYNCGAVNTDSTYHYCSNCKH